MRIVQMTDASSLISSKGMECFAEEENGYVRKVFWTCGDVGRYVVVSLLPESRLISRRSCEAQGCKQIQLPGLYRGERSSAQTPKP